jgi:carbamoyl-phosphate synthase large subunit
MKSTGEVMGTAADPGLAYWKAQRAAGNDPELGGTAVVDLDVDGFEEYFDVETFDDVPSAIRRGAVDFVVSRDVDALRTAVEEEVPYLSTAESAAAMLEAFAHHDDDLDVAPVSDRPIRDEQWG